MKSIFYFSLILISKSILSQGVVENAHKDFLEKGFIIADVAKELNIKEYIFTEVTFNKNNIFDTTSVKTFKFNRQGLLEYYYNNDQKDNIGYAKYKRHKKLCECVYSFDIDSNAYLIDKSVEYRYNNNGMKSLELVGWYDYYYYPNSFIEKTTDSTIFLYEKDNIKAELTYRDQKLLYKTLYEYTDGDRKLKKEIYYDEEVDDIDSPVINRIEYYQYDSNLTLTQKLEIPIRFVSKDTVIIGDTIIVNYAYNKMGQAIKKTQISKKYSNFNVIVNYENELPVEVISNETGNESRNTVSYNNKSLPYRIMRYSTNKGVEELRTIQTIEYVFY